MKIIITDEKTIKEIQDEFNSFFPYLQLEFFSKLHQPGEASEKKFMEEKHKTLLKCRTIHANGEIMVSPKMRVSVLEENFRIVHGLSAQVFRKSGNVWLETSFTDHLTLEEQNKLGEVNSEPTSTAGGQ